MNKKPLNFWQMINLNAGFLGIQFGWALQMANMSGIYKFLGASEANLGYLWLAAPLTGMIIQPILGRISDHTWTRLGRRRPYILFGALLSTLALIFMPNSISVMMAASLLLVLDGSLNISMQPYRALVADVAPENQQTKTFAVQTFLVGIGSTLASALPWILQHGFHMVNTAGEGQIPTTIRLSFYIGAGVFLAANLWTVFKSEEYPPEDMQAWNAAKAAKCDCNVVRFFSHIISDFVNMPKVMKEICFVQFFTWMGWFCLFIYYSLGISQNLYGLPAGANVAENAAYAELLSKGVALNGLCFAAYTLVSFIYALLIPYIAKIISRKGTHILSLALGGAGMILSRYAHSEIYFFISMIGVGAAWASTVTIPYAILGGSIPKDKIGVYMGLFNIMICTPEIIAGLTLGAIVHVWFDDIAMSVIQLGGVFFFIAALLTLFVRDKKVEELV